VSRHEWIEPGAYPVAPGIHRIPLPVPLEGLHAINVYALQAPDGLVLIDGGWSYDEADTALHAGLKEMGAEPGDIRHVIVTHVHGDHYSNAVVIRRRYGATVSLGLGERPTLATLRSPDAMSLQVQLGQLLRCDAEELAQRIIREGHRHPVRTGVWEEPDNWLVDGRMMTVGERQLQALATPGHTIGHFVFVDRAAGLLFTGDHVLPHITPSIGFQATDEQLALGAFIDSLRMVRSMPDMRMLPAHGPVTDSVHARIDELLAHHEERLQLCVDVVEAGIVSAYEVARQLPWTRHHRRFGELSSFNQMLAVLETNAHLELLAAQDRMVMWHDDDAVLRYRPG
jgi:glyoxylase-like metal-dependent hydrolase (beta-lactamase superfamily II)